MDYRTRNAIIEAAYVLSGQRFATTGAVSVGASYATGKVSSFGSGILTFCSNQLTDAALGASYTYENPRDTGRYVLNMPVNAVQSAWSMLPSFSAAPATPSVTFGPATQGLLGPLTPVFYEQEQTSSLKSFMSEDDWKETATLFYNTYHNTDAGNPEIATAVQKLMAADDSTSEILSLLSLIQALKIDPEKTKDAASTWLLRLIPNMLTNVLTYNNFARAALQNPLLVAELIKLANALDVEAVDMLYQKDLYGFMQEQKQLFRGLDEAALKDTFEALLSTKFKHTDLIVALNEIQRKEHYLEIPEASPYRELYAAARILVDNPERFQDVLNYTSSLTSDDHQNKIKALTPVVKKLKAQQVDQLFTILLELDKFDNSPEDSLAVMLTQGTTLLKHLEGDELKALLQEIAPARTQKGILNLITLSKRIDANKAQSMSQRLVRIMAIAKAEGALTDDHFPVSISKICIEAMGVVGDLPKKAVVSAEDREEFIESIINFISDYLPNKQASSALKAGMLILNTGENEGLLDLAGQEVLSTLNGADTENIGLFVQDLISSLETISKAPSGNQKARNIKALFDALKHLKNVQNIETRVGLLKGLITASPFTPYREWFGEISKASELIAIIDNGFPTEQHCQDIADFMNLNVDTTETTLQAIKLCKSFPDKVFENPMALKSLMAILKSSMNTNSNLRAKFEMINAVVNLFGEKNTASIMPSEEAGAAAPADAVVNVVIGPAISEANNGYQTLLNVLKDIQPESIDALINSWQKWSQENKLDEQLLDEVRKIGPEQANLLLDTLTRALPIFAKDTQFRIALDTSLNVNQHYDKIRQLLNAVNTLTAQEGEATPESLKAPLGAVLHALSSFENIEDKATIKKGVQTLASSTVILQPSTDALFKVMDELLPYIKNIDEDCQAQICEVLAQAYAQPGKRDATRLSLKSFKMIKMLPKEMTGNPDAMQSLMQLLASSLNTSEVREQAGGINWVINLFGDETQNGYKNFFEDMEGINIETLTLLEKAWDQYQGNDSTEDATFINTLTEIETKQIQKVLQSFSRPIPVFKKIEKPFVTALALNKIAHAETIEHLITELKPLGKQLKEIGKPWAELGELLESSTKTDLELLNKTFLASKMTASKDTPVNLMAQLLAMSWNYQENKCVGDFLSAAQEILKAYDSSLYGKGNVLAEYAEQMKGIIQAPANLRQHVIKLIPPTPSYWAVFKKILLWVQSMITHDERWSRVRIFIYLLLVTFIVSLFAAAFAAAVYSGAAAIVLAAILLIGLLYKVIDSGYKTHKAVNVYTQVQTYMTKNMLDIKDPDLCKKIITENTINGNPDYNAINQALQDQGHSYSSEKLIIASYAALKLFDKDLDDEGLGLTSEEDKEFYKQCLEDIHNIKALINKTKVEPKIFAPPIFAHILKVLPEKQMSLSEMILAIRSTVDDYLPAKSLDKNAPSAANDQRDGDGPDGGGPNFRP